MRDMRYELYYRTSLIYVILVGVLYLAFCNTRSSYTRTLLIASQSPVNYDNPFHMKLLTLNLFTEKNRHLRIPLATHAHLSLANKEYHSSKAGTGHTSWYYSSHNSS